MPRVAQITKSTAGGVILGPGASSKLRITGLAASLKGDLVSGHGESPHSSPSMVEGSTKLRVGGVPVVLAGHMASCGHTAGADSKMTCSV